MQPWKLQTTPNPAGFTSKFIPAFLLDMADQLHSKPHLIYLTLQHTTISFTLHHNITTSISFLPWEWESSYIGINDGRESEPSFLFLFFSVRKPEREERDLWFGLSSIRELVQSLRPEFLHPAASQSKGERKRELAVCIFFFFWTAERENCCSC